MEWVRSSEWRSGEGTHKHLRFSGLEYPNEFDLRKAIELAVSQQNRVTEKARDPAYFSRAAT